MLTTIPCTAATETTAQPPSILEKRITIVLRGQPVTSALAELGEALGVPIVAAVASDREKVTLVARDRPAPEVLQQLVSQIGPSCSWQQRGGIVVIREETPTPEETQEAARHRGRELDYQHLFEFLEVLGSRHRRALVAGEELDIGQLTRAQRTAFLRVVRALDERRLTKMETGGHRVTLAFSFTPKMYVYREPPVRWERTGIDLW